MAPAPRPLILSGPNGAGKTTFAGKLLAVQDEPLPFLNADIEAQRLSPGADAAAAVPAGRAVLSAMADLLDRRIGFAVETTLSGRHHQMLAYRALNEGWLVDLHYLWLDSVELAVRRVAFRVASGGHDIPTEVIQRRYGRGLANLPIMCGIVSRWTQYDNSSGRADPIAGADSASAAVYDFEVFDRIVATGGTVKWRNVLDRIDR